jgi:histidinol-phosphate aminotransferase
MQYPTYIQSLSSYVAGKPIDEVARQFNLKPENIIKLASNENPHGMPQKAKQAILNYLNYDSLNNYTETARYPDANQFNLRQILSQKLNIDANCLTFGNGSNDILELIVRTFVDPQTDSVMYDQYGFMVYGLATQSIGAKAQIIPSINYAHNLNAMLNAINKHTKVIFIANPNNPTGTFIQGNDLLQFIQNVPKHVCIVLDEAYHEYLADDVHYDSMQWLTHHTNLIICRTFSKAYGLAALRIGYCAASKSITDYLNRVRQPFNVNSLALIAAQHAITDDVFLHKTRLHNTNGYQQITTGLNSLNIKYIPSYANFVMMHTHINTHQFTGHELNQKLLAQGIIIRPLDNYGLTNYIRVSIGLAHENTLFLNALSGIQK